LKIIDPDHPKQTGKKQSFLSQCRKRGKFCFKKIYCVSWNVKNKLERDGVVNIHLTKYAQKCISSSEQKVRFWNELEPPAGLSKEDRGSISPTFYNKAFTHADPKVFDWKLENKLEKRKFYIFFKFISYCPFISHKKNSFFQFQIFLIVPLSVIKRIVFFNFKFMFDKLLEKSTQFWNNCQMFFFQFLFVFKQNIHFFSLSP